MTHSEFGKICAKVTLQFLEKLNAADGKENVLISPFSIQTCMALVFNGAKGDTAKEIALAMGYSSQSPSEVAELFHSILKTYSVSDLLKIANKVYIQEGATLKPDYLAITKEKYHAEAEVFNFQENVAAANAMNTWVEQKTNGKIVNLISPDSLEDDTRFVLLNALHFKGQWENKFDPAHTETGDFWISKDKSEKVDQMFLEEDFKYAYLENLNCSALEMPYADSDLSMFVLLPHEREGLKDLANKLQGIDLGDLANNLHKRNIFVRFPKFTIDYSVEMSEVLKNMGVIRAFSDLADFSNIMEPAENICISKVFHKVSIDVNEEGTEAAAATALMPRVCCMPPEFVADHPFLYWIWNKNNIVLFAGSFVKPPKKE